MSRASVSVTFAVGSLHWPDHFACSRSGSVAERSLNAPCPLRDRPCCVVQRRHGETLPHFREVQRLCYDRCLPCRFHKFSSQRATTRRTPTRSYESRNGVVWICRKFHQTHRYRDRAVPSPQAVIHRVAERREMGEEFTQQLGLGVEHVRHAPGIHRDAIDELLIGATAARQRRQCKNMQIGNRMRSRRRCAPRRRVILVGQ